MDWLFSQEWASAAQIVETVVVVVLGPITVLGVFLQWVAMRAQRRESATQHAARQEQIRLQRAATEAQTKAIEQQAQATFLQGVASIISWNQEERVRAARRSLYEFDEKYQISRLAGKDWREEAWRTAADQACQALNSCALIAMHVPAAQWWIKATRYAILKTLRIAKPWIQHRRETQDPQLWDELRWLEEQARKYVKPGENF